MSVSLFFFLLLFHDNRFWKTEDGHPESYLRRLFQFQIAFSWLCTCTLIVPFWKGRQRPCKMIGMPQRMNNGQSQLLKLPSANPSWPGSLGINCVRHFYTYHYRKSMRVTSVFLFWELFPYYYPLCYWQWMAVRTNTREKYVWYQLIIPSVLKYSPAYECSDMRALQTYWTSSFRFSCVSCQLNSEGENVQGYGG